MRITTVEDDKEFYDKGSRLPYLTTLISIPEELGHKIEIIRKELRRVDNRQIYHHPSYFHITIKGLGWLGESVKEDDLPKIKDKVKEVASSTSPFSLTLKGIRVWPTVIYANVEEGRERVKQMHLKMLQEPRGYKVTPSDVEGERMHPHVTIATFAVRDAENLLQEVKRFENADIGKMQVDRISLVKTVPHIVSGRSEEHGSFLEEVASFPLGSMSSKS